LRGDASPQNESRLDDRSSCITTGPLPIRRKFGLILVSKALPWGSVEVPVIMPKPDLTALTRGYRKTPVLQIGADIYCDSQLIMHELERLHPGRVLSGGPRRGRRACLVGQEDHVQTGREHRVRQETRRVARRISRRPGQILWPKYRSRRDEGGSIELARSVARAFRLAEPDADRQALVLAGFCR
jgi:glutathione S-transferase